MCCTLPCNVYLLLLLPRKRVKVPAAASSGSVQTMLKPFLQHHYWGRHGNIPALVILMQAYLQKAPQDIVDKQFVQPILGIFQMLLGLSRHYTDATALLSSILAFLPMQVRFD